MSGARFSSLGLLLLCGSISVFWGIFLQPHARGTHMDFKIVYMATRCMFEHCDPYQPSDLERIYLAGEQNHSKDPEVSRIETKIIYLPTVFSIASPFAVLPWPLAHQLWLVFTVVSFFLAAFLTWSLGMEYAPGLTTFLSCFLIVNCPIIFKTENAAGIAVDLCVIAVWCLLQERFAVCGVLCLAISLVIKPHDAGLVWLFFLLAGGLYRRRALQTLVVAVALSLPAVIWISHVSPHWLQELHSNLVTLSARGNLNDPGPASLTARTPNMMISLQTIFSVIRDEPSFYNPATYLVCAALLVPWALKVFRTRPSPEQAWLAIAAVVPLTMLVTYHRPYDAKLILLAIPACAMLWAKGGQIAQWAFAFTTAGVISTADFPLGIIVVLSGNLHLSPVGFAGKALTIFLARPVPLALLAMASFYLVVYLRRAPDSPATMGPHDEGQAEGIMAPS